MSHITPAQIAFDAACVSLHVARTRLVRSKSQVARAAFRAASDTYDAALAVLELEQDAQRVTALADLRARRLAFVEPRRALLARQFSLAL